MQARKDERSLGELFGDLAGDLGRLVRQEIHLASTELSQSASRVAREAGLLAVGGLIAYAGLLALLGAVIVGLVEAGLDWWQSALLVGVVVAVLGVVLIRRSLGALKKMDLAPRQTLETIREDTQWAKDQMT